MVGQVVVRYKSDQEVEISQEVTMKDLGCDGSVEPGPFDERVIANIEKKYPLDRDYLDCMKTCHGRTPRLGSFEIKSGVYQVGLFLTLFDKKSELPPPYRPHFDQPDMDERVVNSIDFLTNYEHATSRALFKGLLPFAALQADMCLDRAYVNLLCFDYRSKRKRPPVVLWVAEEAGTAYLDWDRLPFDEQYDENDNLLSVSWDKFLKPVAKNFRKFLKMLQM